MATLFLPAVFWPNGELGDAEDALVTVADGVVVHITRDDGFEVRLLLHELEALYNFAIDEAARHEEAESGRATPTLS